MNKPEPMTDPVQQALIAKCFTLRDRATVLSFLEAHLPLAAVLLDLYTKIPNYFPGSPLFLQIVDTAPTRDVPDGRRLVLFIATDLGEDEAMDRMDQLMAAWLPDVRSRTGRSFSVDIAFGTTTADLDTAAQRYAQRHSDDHEAHRDLAGRLLHTDPGSEQQVQARAELAAGLTGESGAPPSACGGDARAVLARLRRQASANS